MQPLNQVMAGKLLVSILACSLLLTQTALAEYKPDPKQPPPKSGTTQAPRGPRLLPLILLAPRTHVGTTDSLRPTFAWFIRDHQPHSLLFTLWELNTEDPKGEPKQKIHQETLTNSPGIMTFSFPENKPGLTLGKTYLWEVKIMSNSNPSRAIVESSAEIEIVKIPENLSSTLARTQDIKQRANLYAEAGIWYTAISEALKVAPEHKLGEIAASLVEDLADIDKPKPENKCQDTRPTLQEEQLCVWSQNLREISLTQK